MAWILTGLTVLVLAVIITAGIKVVWDIVTYWRES